jgi:hypothetical protein
MLRRSRSGLRWSPVGRSCPQGRQPRGGAAVRPVWDVNPSGWQGPIRSSMKPCVQVRDITIEVCLVGLPCQPIHSGCGILLELKECRLKISQAEVMQERGELLLRSLAPGKRFPGSEPGACFAVPHSPWSPPFAPPAPRPVARLCSSVSQLLWRSLTSRVRLSSVMAPRLPDADQDS